jgi:hypothetical protein
MSIVVRYTPREPVSVQKYDDASGRIWEALGIAEDELPDGCELHVAFSGPSGDVRVSEIWDSREQWEAFGQRLMPVLGEVGIDPGQPEVFEVHDLRTR